MKPGSWLSYCGIALFILAHVGRAGAADAPDERLPPWFVGIEATFFEVEAKTGGRITLSFDDADTAGTDLSLIDGNGYDAEDYAPRVFVGRRFGQHWGLVARAFRLTDSDPHPPALAPGTTPLAHFATLGADDQIELQTFDLEGMYSFTPGAWTIDLALGTRRAEFDADSEVSAFGVFTTGNFVNIRLSNGSSYEGDGITTAVSVDRRFGDGPVHVFLSGRHSHITGESDSFARVVGSVAASPNPPLIGAATVTRNNVKATDLEIREAQLGVFLDFRMGPSRASGFVRAALEVQDWELNGPPTGGAGFGGTISDLTTNSFSSASLGTADLTGVAITAGFTW